MLTVVPRQPAAPVWAQVELVQQPTPTVGAAAGADDAFDPTAQPTPPNPQTAPPTPSDASGKPAEAAAQPGPAPVSEPNQATAGATGSRAAPSAEPPAVRLGDEGETGTGLVSGSAVIPAGLDATVHNRLPAYPAEAARRGEEGVVFLMVQIAPDGHAAAVDVEQSSGYDRLDRAARAAVASWQFRPAMRDGAPRASRMEVEVHFDIRWTPK